MSSVRPHSSLLSTPVGVHIPLEPVSFPATILDSCSSLCFPHTDLQDQEDVALPRSKVPGTSVESKVAPVFNDTREITSAMGPKGAKKK